MTDEVFVNFCKYLVDFFRFPLMDDNYIKEKIKVEGLENIDNANNKNDNANNKNLLILSNIQVVSGLPKKKIKNNRLMPGLSYIQYPHKSFLT